MVVGIAAAAATSDWAAETPAEVAPPEALPELVPAEPEVEAGLELELELQAARARAATARAAPPTILDLTLSPLIAVEVTANWLT
jgi:hypothetical protein